MLLKLINNVGFHHIFFVHCQMKTEALLFAINHFFITLSVCAGATFFFQLVVLTFVFRFVLHRLLSLLICIILYRDTFHIRRTKHKVLLIEYDFSQCKQPYFLADVMICPFASYKYPSLPLIVSLSTLKPYIYCRIGGEQIQDYLSPFSQAKDDVYVTDGCCSSFGTCHF
jgi:hypothetical protein